MTMKEVGKRVKAERMRRGITQDELCNRAGITQPVLSYIEGGWRDTRLSTLLRIAPAAFFAEGKR